MLIELRILIFVLGILFFVSLDVLWNLLESRSLLCFLLFLHLFLKSPLLDALLENQSSLDPVELISDSGGYTDVIFGLFWLLGYRFSPHLNHLRVTAGSKMGQSIITHTVLASLLLIPRGVTRKLVPHAVSLSLPVHLFRRTALPPAKFGESALFIASGQQSGGDVCSFSAPGCTFAGSTGRTD
jgi:hypothetical protein